MTYPKIAISMGDPAGIGPEVILKALAKLENSRFQPVVIGSRAHLKETYKHLKIKGIKNLQDPERFEIHDFPITGKVILGRGNPSTGAASFGCLTIATELVLKGYCNSLVTAPIAKHLWLEAGHRYSGQTERLAELVGVPGASMLFTAKSPKNHWRLNTILATTHIPISQICKQLTEQLISTKLSTLLSFCRQFTPKPHLVVAGLNPHAGELNQLGKEEHEWLIPLLDQWQQEHPEVKLEGPLAPDTCWLGAGQAWAGENKGPDGYLALYHDQGLIPVKLLAFDMAVNVSLGLPFLRTSPDHGTGFGIASEGIARSTSMEAAIITAHELG
uniref:4-hydroxythreonine-4-phosphate dehydrogenase n=1 Tax=Paulinella chromatophora TaxID=39717 RepID=B1X4J4_PAUCH|nr:4-hydroxythreonine-4-phosphate dehydrogenase [Paulinella chromatophora]ACB42863.1 4-hydroxythreonine-4-phosphate dehydrogenase [Paulinella chromatophora]